MAIKMAPPRRRPRRISKRIEERRGAKTFEGGEELRKAERLGRAVKSCRAMVYMFRAAAAILTGGRAGEVVVYGEASSELLAGKSETADRLERLIAMGYRRPAGTLAGMRRAKVRAENRRVRERLGQLRAREQAPGSQG